MKLIFRSQIRFMSFIHDYIENEACRVTAF